MGGQAKQGVGGRTDPSHIGLHCPSCPAVAELTSLNYRQTGSEWRQLVTIEDYITVAKKAFFSATIASAES